MKIQTEIRQELDVFFIHNLEELKLMFSRQILHKWLKKKKDIQLSTFLLLASKYPELWGIIQGKKEVRPYDA